MIEIGCKNLIKTYGGQTVFDDVNFELKTGERIGLIGRNGTGKTTIFKLIKNIENPDEGSIFKRKGCSIGYLHQIPDFEDRVSVEDVINQAFDEVFGLKKQLTKLEEEMASESFSDKIMIKYGELQSKFETLGGYDIDIEKGKILSGFKLDNSFRQKQFNLLSGGEKTTVMLARLLLEKPNVLLLDEPTNHLDIEAVEWLEEFLSNYEGSVIVISHDRYFLDRVCNKIVELEFGKTCFYSGNFTFYQQEKDLKIKQEFEAYKDRQKKIKALKAAAERYRIWGRINTDNNAHMMRAKRYEKMAEELEAMGRPQSAKSMFLKIDSCKRSGKEVIIAEKVSKSFGDKVIFKDADLLVQYQTRIAFLGANGSGKTTFLKILLNDLKPDSGRCYLGASVKIGYLEQEVEFENEDLSILEHYQRSFNLYEHDARMKLAKFLFTKDDVFKKIKNLSGGEKVRLRLCFILSKEINLLLLDEPTNHLDIESRELLEESLSDFHGTLFFISHDRYFINKIADRICEIDNHKIKSYVGNYDYYKEKKNSYVEMVKDVKPKKEKPRISDADKLKRKLQKELDYIHSEIYQLETKMFEFENQMIEFGTDSGKLMEIMKSKTEAEEELKILYERWEEIEEKIG
jgi:ATPase subunit of ABC transporter with duplicated ATPase domains